jgi:hypothetical protein
MLQQVSPAPPRWLLLAFQLPARPSNARVKTWRRLVQLGAVLVRNAVYALPNTDQSREDLEWVRSEVGSMGGGATVFAADAADSGGDADIVAAFQRARNEDYRALEEEVTMATRRTARRGTRGAAENRDRAMRTARERLAAIEKIDFFGAPLRSRAADAVARLERLAAPGQPAQSGKALPRLHARDFQKRRWVTRPRPGVDRMASAWLIRRFIDPKATFAFSDTARRGEIPFDMYAGEFGHHGGACTFETLCARFGITDRAAVHIGHIVHDLDMKETRFGAPEAPAIERLIDGLRAMYADDRTLLDQGIVMFDALSRAI